MDEDEADDVEEELEDDEDDEAEEDEDGEEDEDSGDPAKTLLLIASCGVLIFFILTDPSGAAELGRNLGAFLGDLAEALVEFIDAALADSEPSRGLPEGGWPQPRAAS